MGRLYYQAAVERDYPLLMAVNYIGDSLRDAFDPYKVLETVGEYT